MRYRHGPEQTKLAIDQLSNAGGQLKGRFVIIRETLTTSDVEGGSAPRLRELFRGKDAHQGTRLLLVADVVLRQTDLLVIMRSIGHHLADLETRRLETTFETMMD
jgi:hypothetical protein